jgi:hypothetical protein
MRWCKNKENFSLRYIPINQTINKEKNHGFVVSQREKRQFDT